LLAVIFRTTLPLNINKMWGGGFLRQASETSKQNHDSLRKTRDKAKSLTPLRGARGQVETKRLTEEERRALIMKIKAENKRDFIKKLVLTLVVTLILLIIGLLIFK